VRRITVVVGTAGHREAMVSSERKVAADVVRRVLAVMGLDGVEPIGHEDRDQFVTLEETRMRQRRHAARTVNLLEDVGG